MFSQRLMLYVQDVWNNFDVLSISLFITGLMFSWSFNMGHGILCMDYMVFTLRLIHIFAIHRQLGPKIIILGKMIKDAFFLFFLAVWLSAYGVANQALLYQYDPTGKYWDIDCTDNLTLINEGKEPCRDTSHNWLVVILLVIFLLVTNILLVNLLIATFRYLFIYSSICCIYSSNYSPIYWKFQRYNLIVEYHSRPTLKIITVHLPFIIAVQLKGRDANKLVKWETLQKENILALENKKTKRDRLKRITAK
uniref:Ion transport domain-containing protein n=1 Tax=Cyprinus carpio TaxID=7962 RepID=A0A8C1XYV6_CYPCA